MDSLVKSEASGFQALFTVSVTGFIALIAWVFLGGFWPFFAMFIGLALSLSIYEEVKDSINSLFMNYKITNQYAKKLAIACLSAQASIVGVVFGWTFGMKFFN